MRAPAAARRSREPRRRPAALTVGITIGAALAALLLASWPAQPAAATVVNLGPRPLEPAATGGLALLDHALAKLSTHKRLLVIAAHPDDEDTALLTLVSRGLGGEAAYLSLSRGEGGQNLIGSELGVGLGLVRSRELLAARGVDGGRQYFTRAYDFGFTMSVEEALREWPQAALVEDAVRVIRRFKPQVVVSIFPGTPIKTHGQHQAAGVTAFAAYPLAGDPGALPALAAEGLAPWSPLALYRSAFFDRGAATMTLSTSEVDPWSGKSVFQLAMASRGMHRSQNMGLLQPIGPQETRLAWSANGAGAAGKDPFAGIDTHLSAIATTIADAGLRGRVAGELDAVAGLAVRTREQLNPARLPQAVGPLLDMVRHLRAALALLPVGAEVPGGDQAAGELIAEKLRVAEDAVAVAAGVALDATTEREAVTPGESFAVRLQLWDSGPQALAGASVKLVPAPEWGSAPAGTGLPAGESQEVAAGALAHWDLKPQVPAAAAPTEPYFLRRPLHGNMYDWSAATVGERGEPFGPPPLLARFAFTLDGVPITLEREVVHLHRDEVLGEVRRPLRVVPAVEVAVGEAMQIWPLSRRDSKQLRLVLTSHRPEALRGRIEIDATAVVATAAGSAVGAGAAGAGSAGRASRSWPAMPAQPFDLPAAGAAEQDLGVSVPVTIALQPPAGLAAGRYPLHIAAVLDGGARYDLAVPLIDYPHITPTPWPHRAAAEISAFDLKLPPSHHIGYVRGGSDLVPEFLRQAGLPIELLGAGELLSGDLARYDAIVIGSRAYETDPVLARANARLLDYVRGGGLMIVQYQEYPFINGNFAPFKLEIARPGDRVTDETAAVTVLDPASPIFNVPNKIGAADWDGWVQERGLYFAHTWDAAYTPLLSMADPGGEAQRGALLVASVGKGKYVYTGLALFRQLPAGVPGGYRLFANLLALR